MLILVVKLQVRNDGTGKHTFKHKTEYTMGSAKFGNHIQRG